jgi:diketogulonate reductase-like aldo/keto reductase
MHVQIYGTELEVGLALKEYMDETKTPRSSIYLTTKVYPQIANIPLAMEQSLDRLGPAVEGYVDLYLIHAPFWDKSTVTLKEAWEKMEGLVKDGKTRSIGVSNFRVEDLDEIESFATIPVAVNQVGDLSDLSE